MSLPKAIKQTREALFMSQEQFAKELNVAVTTINRWENGHSKPNLTAMKNIKEFCKNNNLPFESIEYEWHNI